MKASVSDYVVEQDVFIADMMAQMEAIGLPLTDAQGRDFYTYYVHLIKTNAHMNLTAITDAHEVVVKHMIDSLSCYDKAYFFEGARLLDVGTGAGFPGIPLAIYRRDLQVTLFDSLQKRLRFLQDVIDMLNLTNVTTLHGRAEDMSHHIEHRERYDVVTSRAVARLPILAEWTLPYVKVGGYCIALKGAIYEEELEESERALSLLGGAVREIRPITLPTMPDKRAVVYLEKQRKTPTNYPRKPKDIKARPL